MPLHMNPTYTLPPISPRSVLILSSYPRLGLPSGTFATEKVSNKLRSKSDEIRFGLHIMPVEAVSANFSLYLRNATRHNPCESTRFSDHGRVIYNENRQNETPVSPLTRTSVALKVNSFELGNRGSFSDVRLVSVFFYTFRSFPSTNFPVTCHF